MFQFCRNYFHENYYFCLKSFHRMLPESLHKHATQCSMCTAWNMSECTCSRQTPEMFLCLSATVCQLLLSFIVSVSYFIHGVMVLLGFCFLWNRSSFIPFVVFFTKMFYMYLLVLYCTALCNIVLKSAIQIKFKCFRVVVFSQHFKRTNESKLIQGLSKRG